MDLLLHGNRFTSFSIKSIGAFTVVGLVLMGCVSQGSYDTVVEENARLKKQAMSTKANLKLSQNQSEDKSAEKEVLKKELEFTTDALVSTSELLIETEELSAAAKKFYDSLVGELAGELQDNKVTIDQMKSGVNVNLPGDILFASGSAEVSADGKLLLHKLGKSLTDVPYQTIVAGFTDNASISDKLAKTFPTNWDLAATRATRVLTLLEKSGVSSSRLLAVSFGENQPVASNDDTSGRQKNRRIEIRLRPVIQ